jgi:CHAT domain-containing protein
LTLLCGLACRQQASPQVLFDQASQTFRQGDFEQCQQLAERQFQRLQHSDPDWAWRFRLLHAKSLLWRGMFSEALALLNSPAPASRHRDEDIERMALQGAILARVHKFSEAEKALAPTLPQCQSSWEPSCGDALLAQGVLNLQKGNRPGAKQVFLQCLQAGRAHHDQFLEATALLNLGATALQDERYDETIDWTQAANDAALRSGFGNTTRTAQGNLGFAYFKLGDMENSLRLSLQAEESARKAKTKILDLYFQTNVGYVYAETGDSARAKQTYLQALNIAQEINSQEGIYNACRALALVSVAMGDLDDARKYSDQAITLARADNNRFNELFPLLVQGSLSAKSRDYAAAEQTFREVESDPHANLSLKWRALHALARLYQEQRRNADADRSYRASLTTFETERGSLRRNEAKLPFSGNGSQIYDDYIHFLMAQQKSDDALRWAEYSRARTLAEGLQLLSPQATSPPPTLDAQAIARRAGGNILFYWLGEKQSFLWVITARKITLFDLPPRKEIEATARRYRDALNGPRDVLESGDRDGQWLYMALVAPAADSLKGSKTFIIPDGSLNNLNFETLLVPGSKPHYWIEDATVANAGSLRLLAASAASRKQGKTRRLLLMGNSVAPNDKYPELRKAASQMASIEKHFLPENRKTLSGAQATPGAYLNGAPEQFSYIHFVAHGTASRTSPLDSAIILSRSGAADDSFKLYARDILAHPLHAQLVTISACYGSGERAFSGEGLVGLSWAFLWAGAHNVVGALWEVTDVSTDRLMDRFYDELDKGAPPEAALRNAKLSLLHSEYRKAFYWGPFQLYSGS